ncbi:hypothetical protein QTP88_006679 [Uroleucon formosanum]
MIMKSIYAVVLCVLLSTRDAFTFCGNNEQIDDLKTSLIIHESTFIILATSSAVPIPGTVLTLMEVLASGSFGIRLQKILGEMKGSLNKVHKDYPICSEILEKTITAAAVIKSTDVGLALVALIPGVNLALIPPRIATSLGAIVLIRDGLEHWESNNCQYATGRDCDI